MRQEGRRRAGVSGKGGRWVAGDGSLTRAGGARLVRDGGAKAAGEGVGAPRTPVGRASRLARRLGRMQEARCSSDPRVGSCPMSNGEGQGPYAAPHKGVPSARVQEAMVVAVLSVCPSLLCGSRTTTASLKKQRLCAYTKPTHGGCAPPAPATSAWPRLASWQAAQHASASGAPRTGSSSVSPPRMSSPGTSTQPWRVSSRGGVGRGVDSASSQLVGRGEAEAAEEDEDEEDEEDEEEEEDEEDEEEEEDEEDEEDEEEEEDASTSSM